MASPANPNLQNESGNRPPRNETTTRVPSPPPTPSKPPVVTLDDGSRPPRNEP